MTKTLRCVCRYAAASILGLSLSLPISAQAALDDIVFLKGTNTDTQVMSFGVGGAPETTDMQAVCANIAEFLGANEMVGPGGYGGPGAELLNFLFPPESGSNPGDELGPTLAECANAPPDSGDYVIMFTTCSMHMLSGGNILIWAVPPGAPEALMAIVDAESQELIGGSLLESDLAQVMPAAQGRARGTQQVTGPTGSEDWVLLVKQGQPETAVFNTESFSAGIYDFNYEGDISLASMGMGGISIGNIKSDGTAHIVSDFPGGDVIGKFYQNFRDEVVPVLASGSLMTQMFEQMADLASRGVPVHTEQTITMGGGMTSLLGSAGAGAGSRSTNTITHVGVWEGGAAEAELCGYTNVPDGWTETSLNQMMAGGAGSGMSEQEMQQASEGMEALNQVMGQMNSGQGQETQGSGLGAMMQQLMGANPAGQAGQAAQAPAGQTQAPAGAAPAGSSAGSLPSSDSLMTDDMTQSVQNHLQALGYDPGNTDGSMSTETVIAISQFQAEKGMEVTGEVSPQLLGILGAEVDSR